MPRYKGSFISTIYDTNKRFPLDARMLVAKYDDLINPETWRPAGQASGDALYDGMLTVVSEPEHRAIYCLLDRSKVTHANYRAYETALNKHEDTSEFFSMWEKYSSSTDVDNLLKDVAYIMSTYASKEYVDNALLELRDTLMDSISQLVSDSVNDVLNSGSFSVNKITYGEF